MMEFIKKWGILFVTIMFFIAMDFMAREEKDTSSTEIYCVVEDKHSSLVVAGKAIIRKHYLDVYVEGAPELSDSILVSGTLYNEVTIGDEVKCVIFYEKDKLVGIEIME